MLGARPPESPASIQTAATTGAAATNSVRAAVGIATFGIIERSAPGPRRMVSGEATTATPPTTVSALRTTKAIVFAEGVSWIARPASSEPKRDLR